MQVLKHIDSNDRYEEKSLDESTKRRTNIETAREALDEAYLKYKL